MASFELGQMLGRGEVISKLQMSWHELCEHGDKSFDLPFLPIRDVQPFLTLEVAAVQTRGNPLFTEKARHTYGGHTQFAKYVTLRNVADLTDAVSQFRFVLDRCPAGHPHHAAALTNLAWARLQGHILKDIQGIGSTISLFRKALALRLQRHPDHPFYVCHLTEALTRRPATAASISETAQLYYELLPFCPEGTYLRSIAIETIASVVLSTNATIYQ